MRELKWGREAVRGVWAFLLVLGRAVARATTSPLSSLIARKKRLELVTLEMVHIGSRVLAHEPRSGFVHLLDEVSSRVLSALQQNGPMSAAGVGRPAAKKALKRLLGAGLVRPSRKTPGRNAKR
jgi:hypothetical protein